MNKQTSYARSKALKSSDMSISFYTTISHKSFEYCVTLSKCGHGTTNAQLKFLWKIHRFAKKQIEFNNYIIDILNERFDTKIEDFSDLKIIFFDELINLSKDALKEAEENNAEKDIVEFISVCAQIIDVEKFRIFSLNNIIMGI